MDALPRAAENALTCGYPPVQAVSQSQDPSLDLNYRQQGEYIGMPIQCPYPAHPIGTNAFESTDQPQLSHLGYPIVSLTSAVHPGILILSRKHYLCFV